MRFIECMVRDSVKPLYFKVHEVMTRQELDGRNSTNVPTDFYDEVTKVFNCHGSSLSTIHKITGRQGGGLYGRKRD
jgi:hypothetical protein